MREIIERDQTMKRELSEVYDHVARFVTRDVDQEIRDVLVPIYGEYENTVAMYMSELVNDECPIVVAGNTMCSTQIKTTHQSNTIMFKPTMIIADLFHRHNMPDLVIKSPKGH